MPSTPRPNRINVDLQQYKQPWIDYCKANHVTPSDALRQVVAKLTGHEMGSARPPDFEPLGKVRKEVRLTQEEIAAVSAIAEEEGFHFSRWIVALIRARVGRGPQLGQRELEALARSNMYLLALGRNIHQIAKSLHANPNGIDGAKLAEIAAVGAAIKNHADLVNEVMEANIKRWSVK